MHPHAMHPHAAHVRSDGSETEFASPGVAVPAWNATCLAVAGYMAGSRLFEAGGDEVNAGRLRCNLVSLLRRSAVVLGSQLGSSSMQKGTGSTGTTEAVGRTPSLLDDGVHMLLQAGAELALETALVLEERVSSLLAQSREHRGRRASQQSEKRISHGAIEPRVAAARSAGVAARREQGAMQVAVGALMARGLAEYPVEYAAETAGGMICSADHMLRMAESGAT